MNELTEKVMGCAIEVHRALGSGLLENIYEKCLAYELRNAHEILEQFGSEALASPNAMRG